MPQAGIHSILGMAVQKWTPNRMWLLLGIVLGNLLPDADNFAVAAATVAGLPTGGLHRTFTHSLFFVGAIVILFYAIARLTHNSKWNNLGIGLGIGVVMHILLDLLIWFNGMEILWPFPSWINLWTNVIPPEWWIKLMLPLENLAFVFFFIFLAATARKRQTDIEYLPKLRLWTIIQAVLFIVFMILVFTMERGFMTIYGAVYLLSLGLAFGVTIRMRDTVEARA